MNEYNLVTLTEEQKYLIDNHNELEYQLNLSRMDLEKFCTFELYKDILTEFANKNHLEIYEYENSVKFVYGEQNDTMVFKIEIRKENKWSMSTIDWVENGKFYEIYNFINHLEYFRDELREYFEKYGIYTKTKIRPIINIKVYNGEFV